MKINIKALLIIYTSLFLSLNLIQCSSLVKNAPEYKGVDPRVGHFVKEYKELAKRQGLTFNHDVTIGFKKINDGATVGLTHYGNGWREIDVDSLYWDNISEMHRWALISHELSHAYCNRNHDWGKGIPYPEYETWKKGKEPKEGRYKDGTNCPLSIMYPVVLDDFCMLMHYSDYMIELFNRCEPY